jgi:hypothetical protein
MNVYIKSDSSYQFAAVRAKRAQVLKVKPDAVFVAATKKMRALAIRGIIPTLRITADGRLGHL